MPDPLCKARSASLRREAQRSSPAVNQQVVGEEQRAAGAVIGCQIPGLPAELIGVSVKELVKALGLSSFLLLSPLTYLLCLSFFVIRADFNR